MPFIDCKVSKKLTDSQKDEIKSELGKALSVMNKTENYLMVGIVDGYELYFGGKKVQNGAFVSVSVLGNVVPTQSDAMTGKICEILSSVIGANGNEVYVTYQGFSNWGWNGSNF